MPLEYWTPGMVDSIVFSIRTPNVSTFCPDPFHGMHLLSTLSALINLLLINICDNLPMMECLIMVYFE